MLSEILTYLAAQLDADLGASGPYAADSPLRLVQIGRPNPVTLYPSLYLEAGPTRSSGVEFGHADPSRGIERTYTVYAYVAVIGASYTAAQDSLETQAGRLELWAWSNDGLGGLASGTEETIRSEPGTWTPRVSGSGNKYQGILQFPIVVTTQN